MKKIKKILIFNIFVFLAISLIGKNIYIGTGVTSYYSDNIFMNSTAIDDVVSQFSIDLNYEKKNFNFYANGNTNLFLKNPDFNSFNLDLGIEFLKYLKGRNFVYMNAGYHYLEYKDYFTDFNYSGPFFQTGLKFYLTKTILFKGGYNFESRDYMNFSSFDFQNHTFFIEVNKFFQSQTTVRLQTGMNYRYYPHIAELSMEDYSYGKENAISVPNFYSLMRISQGIGTKVGLISEVEFRKNFRGLENFDTLINNAYVIYPYNDNYLWDGFRVSMGVKYIFKGEVGLTLSLSYFKKNYPGVFVMDEEGIVTEPIEERKDTLKKLDISISKRVGKYNFFLGFSSADNSSLDPFFTYKMLTLSVGIKYYF